MAITPADIKSEIDLGYELKKSNNLDAAIEKFNSLLTCEELQAQEFGSKDQMLILKRLHYGVASCHFVQENFPQAIFHLKQINRKTPAQWLLLAKCCDKNYEYGEAKGAIKSAKHHLEILKNNIGNLLPEQREKYHQKYLILTQQIEDFCNTNIRYQQKSRDMLNQYNPTRRQQRRRESNSQIKSTVWRSRRP